MAEDKIQWHPVFATALKNTLKEYLHLLTITTEHQLALNPLQVDILIVKKNKDVHINKDIATIFKMYNIIEYKSPEDYLSIDDYYKVRAYAYHYKTLVDGVDSKKIEDMTITMVSSRYPRETIKHIKSEQGLEVVKRCDGIYDVKSADITTQLIVVDKLKSNDCELLRLLTTKEDIRGILPNFIKEVAANPKNSDYEMILSTLLRANIAQVMEVYEMAKTITQAEQEAVERVVLKFNMNSKWVDEGKREGEKDGEKKKGLEIARNMLFEGCDVEFVSKVTGLALDEVRGLKRELAN